MDKVKKSELFNHDIRPWSELFKNLGFQKGSNDTRAVKTFYTILLENKIISKGTLILMDEQYLCTHRAGVIYESTESHLRDTIGIDLSKIK